MDPLIGAALISGAASLGGGFMSAQGASSANAANLAQANMINQQMLNAEMAKHAQNTAFMEDQQQFNREERQYAESFNASQAAQARTFSAEQAEKFWHLNTGFQERMASTAYQRAMADMKKAGLNPLLAYKMGGAAAPQGGMPSPAAPAASISGASSGMASGSGAPSLRTATILNDKEALGRALGNAVSSAVDTMKTAQGVEVMKQDEKLREVQQEQTRQDALKKREETFRTNAEIDNVKQQGKNMSIEELILKANAVTAVQNARVAKADADASERYGGKYAPATLERVLRSLQDSAEREGGQSMWDILHKRFNRPLPGSE